MRGKGFTLIELLGVIIILGVVLLIATPVIRNMTSNGKEQLYIVQINNIKDGLKNWAIDNNRLLPENEGETITITLGQLKTGGYVDSDLENPKSNKCFGNDMLLTVKRYQKNYIYTVVEESGTETDSCDEYIKPYIILNGDSITYVEFGNTYEDLGVVAKDSNGNDITSSVSAVISGSGDTIDTSVIGNKYTITYSVTSDNNTVSINRMVIVRDTIAPILTIPENIVLDIATTSFDVMEGISATDNSGETVNVTAKSNISFGIPGEYIITYAAQDSSGNSTVKKRIVTILPSSTKRLSALAVIDSNLGVMSISECLTNKTSCEEGTAFAVRVNETETYKFYAIADTDDEITLIMDRNLGGITAWSDKIENGPTIALEILKNETNNWEYIAEREYNYTDEAEEINIKALM